MARVRKIADKPLAASQYRWLAFLTFGVICGFGYLVYTLVTLQVVRHAELVEVARNNTERTFLRQPKRGDIRDRKGHLLATSKQVETVCADPKMIGTNYLRMAYQLAPALGIPSGELAERLHPRWIEDKQGNMIEVQYVVLKRKVETEEWEQIKAAMATLDFGVDESKLLPKQRAAYNRIREKSLFTTPDQMRFYPNQTLAAHVIGYVGMQDRTTPRGKILETRGQDGLELTMDSVLTGVQGWRQTETDGQRREVVAFREQDVAPKSGLNVILTLDASIQHIVETELAAAFARHTPISISCVVLRPKTGEILAMANLPTFDPNRLEEGNADARRNRLIADNYEPGSTFKAMVIGGALNDGTVDLHHLIDCENGAFRYAGATLHDHGVGYGVLTVEKVLVKSSNIGAAKIALRMGQERLYEVIRAFGFGEKTGIPLPGERTGTVWPLRKWNKMSITRIPMGHEVATTPLQIVMALSSIANGGVLMKPMLIDRFVDDEGQVVAEFHPQPVRRVISEQAAKKMITALKSVVNEDGTGTKAQLAYYTVAGKTGTAQKLVNGHYVHDKHFVSFVGFFPADDPELCISVVMDEPKRGMYGGETAAPVFAKIGERAAQYLAIAPEKKPEKTAMAANGRKAN
jgi:cell division protein FtsI/penicillin-binding protein 2